jgi:hypothetical protein
MGVSEIKVSNFKFHVGGQRTVSSPELRSSNRKNHGWQSRPTDEEKENLPSFNYAGTLKRPVS